jgi:nitrous oxide reductase accessory protein NosL
MKPYKIDRLLSFFLLLLLAGQILLVPAVAGDLEPRKPSRQDKCPVCGMFVYKYPDWTAEIIFRDGATVFFDGAKDFFKFYFALHQYRPQAAPADIAGVYVTEYYDLKQIQAKDAFFVLGSDVYGPMGKELIPFASRSDAEAFMKDHKGRRVLKFENVTATIIDRLDGK